MGKKLNLKWVSDVIGEDYKQWKTNDVVCIQAQTGTGKTFFIKNILVPNMVNKKMLIVANRVNLKRQLKKDLCKYYNNPLPINLEDLDNLNTIGDVTIMSYQQIGNIIHNSKYGGDKLDLSKFDYIVCDECHFFMTDASFNNKCDLAFFELIRKKHDAIKIFISATMDEIKDSIAQGSKDCGSNLLDPYSTNIDYSYVDVSYFKRNNDIIQTIKNDKSDNKWLIFVKNKKEGNYILDELSNYFDCEFITRDTDIKKSNSLKNIINESKFDCKVLICTKAMDNGINIDDVKLRNMVIMSYDMITFIQELGRKRVNIDNAQTINLYIPMFGFSNFNTLIEKVYKPKVKMLELFEKNNNEWCRQYDRNHNYLPTDIFCFQNGKWQINLNGMSRLYKDKSFAEDIITKFKKGDKFAYVKEQLKWLGLEDIFNEDNLIENVADDDEKVELSHYLEELFNNKVVFLQAKDREPLIKQIGLIDKKRSSLGIKSSEDINLNYVKNIDTLNSYLNKALNLSYSIKQFETSRIVEGKKKKYKSAWKIVKTIG